MSSPFNFANVDDTVHARTRLAVLTYLASVESADFKSVREATGTTEGNLSVHLQKLEAAGYVALAKSFLGRRPNTRASITDAGRDALIDHIDQLEAAFSKARRALKRR
ncbi:MAG: winged helix-turn-helix domain-containing protein [Parvularculaceae bacterium]